MKGVLGLPCFAKGETKGKNSGRIIRREGVPNGRCKV